VRRTGTLCETQVGAYHSPGSKREDDTISVPGRNQIHQSNGCTAPALRRANGCHARNQLHGRENPGGQRLQSSVSCILKRSP